MKTDKILFITLAISILASLGFVPSILAQTNSTNATSANATASGQIKEYVPFASCNCMFVPRPGYPGQELIVPVTDPCPPGYNATQFCANWLSEHPSTETSQPQQQQQHHHTSSGGTSGHTPEYKQGFSAGKTDALNSGIYDVGSSCGGYSGTQCNHYIAGYHDGYYAACGSSKFVGACSGDASGTFKSSSSNSCTSEGCNGDFTCVNPNQPPGVPGCPNDRNNNNNDGYQAGISDYNRNVGDLNHHFECPQASTDPHGAYCQGYDSAIAYMFSDQ